MQDAPGVGRRARSDSPTRNRRGPTGRLTSSEDRGGEPSAKCRGAGREPDGRKRPLGIPAVRDRVVQQAVKLVIEPIFEADF